MATSRRELALSELLSMRVRSADGRALGRIRDVRIGQLSGEAEVDLVRLGPRLRAPVTVPWSSIKLPTEGQSWATVLARSDDVDRHDPATGCAPGPEAAAALWLGRDVLDSQVVDLAGSRLSRVSDVLLVVDDVRGLRPFAVDLAFGALIARMGLGAVGHRMGSVIVAWEDVYLASAGGHRGELAVAAERLRRLDARTVAEIIARLRVEQASEVLQAVDPSHAATAIAASHDDLRHRLLRALPRTHRTAVLRAAPDLSQELTSGGRAPGGRRLLRTAGWRVRRPPGTQR